MRDKDGLPIGNYSDNPILDTHMYEVEYPDGHKESLAVNAIAENMFAKLTVMVIDTSYLRRSLTTEITDHISSSKILL